MAQYDVTVAGPGFGVSPFCLHNSDVAGIVCNQMQITSAGSRLLSSHLGKVAQHLVGIASPHVSRQSSQLTAGSSFSVSTLSAACQLARRCCQSEPAALKFDVEQLRRFSQSVLEQPRTSPGRGFAAQALSKSGAAWSSPVLPLRPTDRCIL